METQEEKIANLPVKPIITTEKTEQVKEGKPTVMTEDVLRKLDDAFSNSLPDREACLYAGIVPSTLYDYQKRMPGYAERKEQLKLTPNLAARKNIAQALKSGNVVMSQWWLERKDPDFKPKAGLDIKGKIQLEDISISEGVAKAIKGVEDELDKEIQAEVTTMV